MNAKYLTTALLLLFAVILVNCNDQPAPPTKQKLNPNEESELALLMRDMASRLDSEKIRVNQGLLPGTYPIAFDKIKSAVPTTTKELGTDFINYADLYLKRLNEYHSTNEITLVKERYNNLVQSCAGCHQVECPGPLKRIEKMKIN
jgi:hypothetical protein